MGKNKKIIQLTHNQLTTFISEIVLEASSKRKLDEQFDFSWDGIKNIPGYWEDKIDDTFDFSWEGVNNIDDWWTGKDYIDVADYIEEIVDEASDALSDFADNAEEVAREFADYLVDTYETVADWIFELEEDVYDLGSDVISWVKKQADSVIWYWTKGPGGIFLGKVGRAFAELGRFIIQPSKYLSQLEERIMKAVGEGDWQYLDDLGNVILLGVGIIVVLVTITIPILGMVALSVAAIAGLAFYLTRKNRVIVAYPKAGWEYVAATKARELGIVSGVFRDTADAKRWWDGYPGNTIKKLIIASHGNQSSEIVTDSVLLAQKGGNVKLFSSEFLDPISPHVNANTKVYFTACYGADWLAALKKASEKLGCDCYGCQNIGMAGFYCEGDPYVCEGGNPYLKDMLSGQGTISNDFQDDLEIPYKCRLEPADNAGSIQGFLLKRSDTGKEDLKMSRPDFKFGSNTSIAVANYLGIEGVKDRISLLNQLKPLVGNSPILRGGIGPETTKLISYLLVRKCVASLQGKGTIKSSLEDFTLLPNNETIINNGGCSVLTSGCWWCNFLS